MHKLCLILARLNIEWKGKNVAISSQVILLQEQRAANDFITALKTMFNKFSSNIDHSGLHEDVSHMTHQLQQTWDELKRGLTRSWETVKTSAQDSVAPYSGQMGAHLEKLFNKAQQMVVSVNDS